MIKKGGIGINKSQRWKAQPHQNTCVDLGLKHPYFAFFIDPG